MMMTPNYVSFSPAVKAQNGRLSSFPLITLLVVLAGLGCGALVAYLLVTDKWQLALALIFALPGLIVLQRYPFLAIIIWLFLGPFLLHTTTNAERQIYWIIHRGLPPLTVGLIVVGSALGIRPKRLPAIGFPELLMLSYIVFGTLSIVLQSTTPQATFYHFYDRVISPMCLYFIVRLTLPGEKEWRWLMPVFFFIVLSQTTVGILSWVAPSILPSKWLDKVGERTTGTLINPSIYATALFFAGLLLLHGALQLKRGILRNGFTLIFLLCLFGIFISFSRANWLASIFVLGGLCYLYPKFMLKFTAVSIALSLLVGAFVLPPYLAKAEERLFSDQAEGSALDRLPGFLAAYRMFQEKPFFGWGYGNFDVYDRQFMGRVLDFANDNKDHASHNWFLSTLAEQGLIGMGLYFGPFGWWLFLSVKNWSQIPKRGAWNQRLLLILWLFIFAEVVINNFMNMIIFLGHGFWWLAPALMANLLMEKRSPARESELQQKATAVWKAAPLNPY